ncbi:DUF707 domain-containing protein [Hymenobacter negativus]|uniref:DUF707 domain-containing protein n=1 Tax=Hymenobacter negativus TaxID=2795026 RepID=A0ABS3QAI6_9BACT|nr:DUF707 domain-containing protein [Hymenobacter negativus]MBO2008269.1 DUF707 domain-containing protein [Hymenobacter negativus]
MKKFRNLIIAPCGNSSTLFATDWLNDKAAKEFDVCLMFYHANIDDASRYEGVEYFYHLKDFKYRMLHQLLTTEAPQLLADYDYFYFLDDDIAIGTTAINRLFELSRTFGTWVSQAALSHNSFCSWPMFKQNPNCLLRYVGQVEVMAPLFSQEALRRCLGTFNENKSSWGLDSVWSKVLGYPPAKLAIFDDVIMEHTRPVGGGELYKKIQADPYEEWETVTRKYDAIKNNFVECGRLEYVNNQHNAMRFKGYKFSEKLDKLKQRIRDYDVMSRVRRRLGSPTPA